MGLINYKKNILVNPYEHRFYLQLAQEYLISRKSLLEARSCKLAWELSKNNYESRVLLAQALMRINNYGLGLNFFEARTHLEPNNGTYPKEIERIYLLDQIKDSKTDKILVIGEMGRGDMIQFCRYAPLLKPYCNKILGIFPQDLIALFKSSNIFDEVYSLTKIFEIGRAKWIPCVSIAKLFKASKTHPIINKQYLYLNYKIEEKWNDLICTEDSSSIIICLNWSAQRWEKEYYGTDSRNINIESLSPLSNIPGVRFCSVQKGQSQALWENCSFKDKFIKSQKLIDQTHSFEITAAILKTSFACVTVDTSVAHLSGGLGVATWILLKYIPCWRWGEGNNNIQNSPQN